MYLLIKQLLGCLALTNLYKINDFSIGRKAFKETFLRHKGMVSQSTEEIVRKNLMKRKKFSEKQKKNNTRNRSKRKRESIDCSYNGNHEC
jgi:hypothetical protein